MAARVRLKMQCGTVVLLLVVIVVVCAMDLVCGMFEHRHCSHQHPRAHEVSERKKKKETRSSPLSLSLAFTLVSPLLSVCLLARQTLTDPNQPTNQLDCWCSCQLPPSLLQFFLALDTCRSFAFLLSSPFNAPTLSSLSRQTSPFLLLGMKSRDFMQACVSRVTCSHCLSCTPVSRVRPTLISSNSRRTLRFSVSYLQIRLFSFQTSVSRDAILTLSNLMAR